MATPNQIAANRSNAQHSTGPKSEEGKAKSSRNHLSHGFTASATIIPGEDPEEFNALLDDLTDEYQPVTATEQILVEKMAASQWLSLRAFRLQGFAFFGESLNDDKFAIPKDLGLLIRYHTSAERAFHRAHNELVKAQKERKKSTIGFEPRNAQPTSDPLPAKSKTQQKIVRVTWVGPEDPAAPTAPPPEFAKSAA